MLFPYTLIYRCILFKLFVFLVQGEPYVTIKFPWSELMIVVIMMLIVIRLLFKRQTDIVIHDVEKKIRNVEKKIV